MSSGKHLFDAAYHCEIIEPGMSRHESASANNIITLFAVYELPAPLALEADGFDASIPVAIGKLSGSLVTPKLVWPKNDPHIIGPAISEQATVLLDQGSGRKGQWFFWGQVSTWNIKTKAVPWAWLGAVLLKLATPARDISYSEYIYGLGHPIGPPIDQLYSDIDTWFEGLRMWIEVICDQDADPGAPLRSVTVTGQGLRVWTEEAGVVSLPSSANRATTIWRNPEPIARKTLTRVVNLLATQPQPSDAHLILRDARAAHRRHRLRQAVIDAGSAVEIVLADFNRAVTRVTTPSKPTLGWYVDQPKIAAQASLPAYTKRDLVEKRNDAIHNNVAPSWSETAQALKLARQIINNLEPLPI